MLLCTQLELNFSIILLCYVENDEFTPNFRRPQKSRFLHLTHLDSLQHSMTVHWKCKSVKGY